MNLIPIRRSRRVPHAGDIFTFHVRGHGFGFGRVIRDDVAVGQWTPIYLVYIYSGFQDTYDIIPEKLSPRALLMPPRLSGRSPWTKGYLLTLDHRPLKSSDVLKVHSFYCKVRRMHVDENGDELADVDGLCSLYAVGDHTSLDIAISKAIGLECDNE